MDRKIESKKGIAQWFSKKKLPYWLGGLVVVFVAYLLLRSDLRTFRVIPEFRKRYVYPGYRLPHPPE